MEVETTKEDRLEALLIEAGEFFESHLWESNGSQGAHRTLSKGGLDEDVLRAFGVGYAPMGADALMSHLIARGYTEDELEAAGLATRSVRGRLHAHFRARVMFPVRDRDSRIRGFAGLGTHLGPSWSLWVTSPDGVLYRRSEAVYGLDRAAEEIAASRRASVRRDCVDVLRSHQEGDADAVTVHSGSLTRAQLAAMAGNVGGGTDALELELPPGMPVDEEGQSDETAEPRRVAARPAKPSDPDPLLHLKKVAIVIGTALAAINVWTVAPLAAVWIGAQAQGGQVLSLRGVFTVLVVMGVLAFLCAWALTWLHAKYDELTGRPPVVGQTSPWGRRMRGELNEQFRAVYGLSAPERMVAACVLAAFLAFEVWFFFFAGSSIG
jgi:hypothetical protein